MSFLVTYYICKLKGNNFSTKDNLLLFFSCDSHSQIPKSSVPQIAHNTRTPALVILLCPLLDGITGESNNENPEDKNMKELIFHKSVLNYLKQTFWKETQTFGQFPALFCYCEIFAEMSGVYCYDYL